MKSRWTLSGPSQASRKHEASVKITKTDTDKLHRVLRHLPLVKGLKIKAGLLLTCMSAYTGKQMSRPSSFSASWVR